MADIEIAGCVLSGAQRLDHAGHDPSLLRRPKPFRCWASKLEHLGIIRLLPGTACDC